LIKGVRHAPSGVVVGGFIKEVRNSNPPTPLIRGADAGKISSRG